MHEQPPTSDGSAACSRSGTFRIALVSDASMVARSVASVLECNGYSVRHADVSSDARAIGSAADIDAVLVLSVGHPLAVAELCRRLHGDRFFDPSIPILVLAAPDCTRNERLELLGAGAWDATCEPLDGEVLLLKLQQLMRMRRFVGRLTSHAMIDAATGLYTWRGLLRRAEEVVALSARRRKSAAVVAIDLGPGTASRRRSVKAHERALVGRIWRETTRLTDVVGSAGDACLLCIAPDADAQGAEAIVCRIRAALEAPSAVYVAANPLRAGYCVSSSKEGNTSSGTELLHGALLRAGMAHFGETLGESK